MLTVNKTRFSEEVEIGDLYYLSFLFGLFKIEKTDSIKVWSVFGVPVFCRVDELSVLFGVDWHGRI